MWGLRWRRLYWRRHLQPGPLADCWAEPLPPPGRDWRQQPFLVCDGEMSALDPQRGELLSLGWVRIEAGRIVLASATELLLRAQHSVGQSATVHQLRDCDLQTGLTPAEALQQLLVAARGCVLVFHHAALDLAYLDRIGRASFGAPLLLPVVDTLQLERRQLQRRGHLLARGDLSLARCRARYRLPPLPAHRALHDALAAAELLLAQVQRRATGGSLVLDQLR
ncbi:3'-5' exonuclease [Kineobactrum salinum]|uniref:3'-5' exonuclease n=1 Tax=Kineobactrum salinum TaxID=2708301 RepID=A0A6C0U3I4_9GAMM|nr:3'-5' exonuclease [Kineobactrum salinum]QIB66732.1 3'-5' exonuclease [Kineobactrum salinum]